MYKKLKYWESLHLIKLRSKPLDTSRLGQYTLKLARAFNEPDRPRNSDMDVYLEGLRLDQEEIVSEYTNGLNQLMAQQKEERLVLYEKQNRVLDSYRQQYKERLAQYTVERDK